MKRFISLILSAIMVISVISSWGVIAYAAPKTELNVYNWGEYIELEVLEIFQEENPDIKLNYSTFDSNEAMYSKIVSGAASYDVIVPSDYMVNKLIAEDMLAELNYDNIPNYKYISEGYKHQAHDPEDKYSVPYFWGTVAVIYNTKYVDPADVADESLDLLWNEKYAGKILMFDNPRDAFGLALAKLGYSMNSEVNSQWEEAAELLKQQKPIVQAYVMDAIFDKMEAEEAWIAPYYAGDALIIQDSNPDVDFYLPKEGTNLFIDAFCILKTTQHKEEAERFINFMCRPDIAAMNSDTVGYATPNTGAMELLDPEITGHPIVYPSVEILQNNTEVFKNLNQKTQMLQSTLWTNLKIESAEEGEEGPSINWIDAFCIATLAVGGVSFVYLGIRSQRRRKLWKS